MADGRRIYLLAEGRLVNLASGDGHPAEIMDLSFAVQAMAVLHILNHHQEMDNSVHTVSDDLNKEIASYKLKAMGFGIDALSAEQESYLKQA